MKSIILVIILLTFKCHDQNEDIITFKSILSVP